MALAGNDVGIRSEREETETRVRPDPVARPANLNASQAQTLSANLIRISQFFKLEA